MRQMQCLDWSENHIRVGRLCRLAVPHLRHGEARTDGPGRPSTSVHAHDLGGSASIDGLSRVASVQIKTKFKTKQILREKTHYNISCLKIGNFKRLETGEENGELAKHVIRIFRNGIHIWYFYCQQEIC